eukprot:1395272-Amorphochlora_amoeboformis.AAC.1
MSLMAKSNTYRSSLSERRINSSPIKYTRGPHEENPPSTYPFVNIVTANQAVLEDDAVMLEDVEQRSFSNSAFVVLGIRNINMGTPYEPSQRRLRVTRLSRQLCLTAVTICHTRHHQFELVVTFFADSRQSNILGSIGNSTGASHPVASCELKLACKRQIA